MKKDLKYFVATLLLFNSIASFAAPPATSPYMTDPQNEYVQDATTDAINTVNMVLCIMNGMGVADSGMLNKGAYVALIDMNKCNSKSASGGSSSASGASASVNYMNAIVNATRASDAVPMTADVWMSMTDQGKKQNIFVKLTATSAPTTTNPYGVFRLDFTGKNLNGVMQMSGYIDSSAGSLQYYETGPNSSNVALNLTASTLTTGDGIMTMLASPNNNNTNATYKFNYNPTYFHRSDLTNDQCFERAKAKAQRSVWRYGTYDANTGNRVDQANPSFQVTGTYGGVSSYGYASYWGIGFQGLDLNALPDADPVAGVVVNDQRPNNTTTYTLSKVKGKLTKWTNVPSTLGALNGIPFTFYGNLTGLTTPAVTNPATASGWGNWQMVWSNAGTFTVTGLQNCGPTGCTLTSLNPVATVNPTAFNNMSISGWSDSFGGNLNIPSTGAAHASGDAISYFSQSTVIPGSVGAPANLYCLSNCPDAASVLAANNYVPGGAAVVPFNAATTTQWNSGANMISYTYTAGGLQNGGSAMIVSNAAFFAPGSNFQYGVMSGRLFDTLPTAANCPFVPGAGVVCEPSAPTAYYTWSTSTDQWNQTMWLTNAATSAIVTFDPPQNIQYTVPTDAVGGPVVFGTWGGKTIQLQFNGFGNINGIPGSCVSPIDNTAVPCGPNTRYVPAFPIPDGATMSLGTTSLIVKALDAEVRLNNLGAVGVAAAATTACGAMTLTTTLTPPAGGNHDVSAAAGQFSIGTIKPSLSNPKPKMIDGVLQY